MAMMLFHVMFPLFLPMFLLWGLFNWLSYRTAIPVQWPKEVRDAVGLAIDPASLARTGVLQTRSASGAVEC